MSDLITIINAKLGSLIPAETATAHCDVPCGIYETDTMRHAADTVAKMVEKINGLPGIPDGNLSLDDRNNLIRMVLTKEKHAQKCKDELYLLWSDYFKPPHLEKWPDLHDRFWQATKLCAENKQHVSAEAAKRLQDAVAEIAGIFAESKQG